MIDEEPAQLLIQDSRWRWHEGMRDQRGRRIVDLDLYDGEGLPDLTDFATAGLLLGMLDELGAVTDVVRQEGDWIVAVQLPQQLHGYASDTLGEAAAWALLAVWQETPAGPQGVA